MVKPVQRSGLHPMYTFAYRHCIGGQRVCHTCIFVFSSSTGWCCPGPLTTYLNETRARVIPPPAIEPLCSAVVLPSKQSDAWYHATYDINSTIFFFFSFCVGVCFLLGRRAAAAAARLPGGRRSRLWPAGGGTRPSWAKRAGCGRAGGGSTAAWASEIRKARYSGV